MKKLLAILALMLFSLVGLAQTPEKKPDAKPEAKPAAKPALKLSKDGRAVMAAFRVFLAGFNKGDVAAVAKGCLEPAAIIDEFPPHIWQGPNTCTNWMNDFDADAKKRGITDPKVTISHPVHVDVTGDVAYVVLSANYTYKEKGKPKAEHGARWVLSFKKDGADWKITGWSWAKP